MGIKVLYELTEHSKVAQRKRGGPITHRSQDRNLSMLPQHIHFATGNTIRDPPECGYPQIDRSQNQTEHIFFLRSECCTPTKTEIIIIRLIVNKNLLICKKKLLFGKKFNEHATFINTTRETSGVTYGLKSSDTKR